MLFSYSRIIVLVTDHDFVNFFPNISDIIKRTRKIKKRIFAIEAAPAAIPPNPSTAAIIAIMRNVTVQRSIK
jgi:hypothetical protein